jgi:hypothetical protein
MNQKSLPYLPNEDRTGIFVYCVTCRYTVMISSFVARFSEKALALPAAIPMWNACS